MSARIFSTSFESKCVNTTIIQTYAPTNRAEEEVKEDFFLQQKEGNVKVGSYDRN